MTTDHTAIRNPGQRWRQMSIACPMATDRAGYHDFDDDANVLTPMGAGIRAI